MKSPKICDMQDITYTVSPNGKSITFKPCGLTSHNPHDVKKKFCARCHRFMDLVEAARKMRKIKNRTVR